MKHTLDQTYTRLDAHIHTVKHEINIRSYTQSDIRRIKDAYAHDQKRKIEPHIIRHTQDQTSHTHTHTRSDVYAVYCDVVVVVVLLLLLPLLLPVLLLSVLL